MEARSCGCVVECWCPMWTVVNYLKFSHVVCKIFAVHSKSSNYFSSMNRSSNLHCSTCVDKGVMCVYVFSSGPVDMKRFLPPNPFCCKWSDLLSMCDIWRRSRDWESLCCVFSPHTKDACICSKPGKGIDRFMYTLGRTQILPQDYMRAEPRSIVHAHISSWQELMWWPRHM